MKATYISDCPEVLDVKEKGGYAKTKARGTANVTVNCQGESASFPVTVVDEGAFSAGREALVEKWDAAGRALAKKIPKKLTPENGYELFRALKTYLTVFAASPLKEEGRGAYTVQCMMRGLTKEEKNRIAPACSSYERAHSMILHYIAKYHPIYNKKYWTDKDGKYFKVSATQNQITLKMKKKLTAYALLALYFHEVLCDIDGYGPEGAITPLAICATAQKGRFEARGYIGKYEDSDKRYTGIEKQSAFFKVFDNLYHLFGGIGDHRTVTDLTGRILPHIVDGCGDCSDASSDKYQRMTPAFGIFCLVSDFCYF